VKWVPCGQLDCQTCADGAGRKDRAGRAAGIVGRRRGNRLFTRIGFPDLGRLVVTFPESGDLSEAVVAWLRHKVHDIVHAWARAVWGVEVGLHSYVHPSGDKAPHLWRPHVHLQLPLWGAEVAERRVIAMGPLKPHVPKPALNTLRAMLAGLQETAGLGSVAQVKYLYQTDRVKKLHALSYDARSFPRWYAGDIATPLRLGRPTGLLAWRCGLEGIDQWREAIEGPPPELAEPTDPAERVRQGLDCPCCGKPLQLVGVMERIQYVAARDGPILDVHEVKDPLTLDAAYRGTGPPTAHPNDTAGAPLIPF